MSRTHDRPLRDDDTGSFTRHPWASVRTVDENTPLRIKLGILVTVVLAAISGTYWFTTWKTNTDANTATNTATIATIGAKVDSIDAKMDSLVGSVNELGQDVRGVLLKQRVSTTPGVIQTSPTHSSPNFAGKPNLAAP